MENEPQGFMGCTQGLGLRDGGDDFALVYADGSTTSAAMFTQSRFAGPSVTLSRGEDLAAFRGVAVLSKNANVATGAEGADNAVEVRRRAATLAGCEPRQILIASTGVIGVQYPMPVMRERLDRIQRPLPAADFAAAARAIMTTDTVTKIQTRPCGPASITGIAKGVGMIEPNMATMLCFFFTDAEVPAPELKAIFARVVERTFNAVSIDTDTSTSDTACIIANGLAGPVDLVEFERALYDAALALVRSIAADGEGASKLIEVRVTGARDDAQAKRVGKTVVNSPLVKTAIHGADPNWGRITMAIGKCEDDLDVVPEKVEIGFGGTTVYPREVDAGVLQNLRKYLSGSEVIINIALGIADGAFVVYGCDLTEGYIRTNADYTT